MDLQHASVGPADNNAYLLVDSGEALLIDAAADPLTLQLRLESFVLTSS